MDSIQIIPILLLVIGFGGYMLLTFLSRKLQNRAFLPLSEDEKKKIFEAFTPFRKYNLIPAALILILYIVSVKMKLLPIIAINIIFGILYFAYLIATLLFIYFNLNKMGIDKKVNQKVVIALAIQYLGMILVLAILIAYFLVKKFSLLS